MVFETALLSILSMMTLRPSDPSARLWPQTERLKAALLGAKLTDDPDIS